jgi:hypothetical protein
LIRNLEKASKYGDASLFDEKLLTTLQQLESMDLDGLSPEIWQGNYGCSVWAKNKDQFYGQLVVDQFLAPLLKQGYWNGDGITDRYHLYYKDTSKEKQFGYAIRYNTRSSPCVEFLRDNAFQRSQILKSVFYPNRFRQILWGGNNHRRENTARDTGFEFLATKFETEQDLKEDWNSRARNLSIRGEDSGISPNIRRIWWKNEGNTVYACLLRKGNSLVVFNPSDLFWEKWPYQNVETMREAERLF